MPMKPVIDPRPLPRPYPMVCKLLAHRTGIRISPQRAAQLERSALAKLRKGLAELVA